MRSMMRLALCGAFLLVAAHAQISQPGGSGSGTVSSGTINNIAKYTAGTTLGDSTCSEDGSFFSCSVPLKSTAAGGGSVALTGSSSGTYTVQPPAVAGTGVGTFPALTGTIVIPAAAALKHHGLRFDGTNFTPEYAIFSPGVRKFAAIQSVGSTVNNVGDTASNVGTLSGSAPSSTVAQSTNYQQAAATINTNAGTSSNTSMWRIGKNLVIQVRMSPVESANVRYFVGFHDTTAAAMVSGDAVVANYFGFAYCNDAAAGCTADNTVWRCVQNDNSGARTDASSGVTFTANAEYLLEAWEDSSNTRIYYRINGADVCSSPISTDMPTSGTNTSWTVHQQVLVAATQNNVKIASIFAAADK
jgi:hypothetical protein